MVVVQEAGERAGFDVGTEEFREAIGEIRSVDQVFVAVEEDVMFVGLESLKMLVVDDVSDECEEFLMVLTYVFFPTEKHRRVFNLLILKETRVPS